MVTCRKKKEVPIADNLSDLIINWSLILSGRYFMHSSYDENGNCWRAGKKLKHGKK